MSRLIQVRNVPPELHRTLKVRAAEQGRTLSDYVLEELERVAARPTPAQMLERLAARERVGLERGQASAAVHEGRRAAGRE